MKAKIYPYSKDLKLSFYTRSVTLEMFFGNPREEEENIAYSILKSIFKVRRP